MKKILIIIILCAHIFVSAQTTPSEVLRITGDDIEIGKNLSIGKLVYDVSSKKLWVTNTSVMSSVTISTAPASFTEIAYVGDIPWEKSGSYIFQSTLTDSVGIGTNSPASILDVAGCISFTGTGSSVLIGTGAGYADDYTANANTYIGTSAGTSSTTGSNNTAIGAGAISGSTTGEYTTAVGYNCGTSVVGSGLNRDPEHGTYLGAGILATAYADNELILGAYAKGNGSNTATIGDDNVTDVYMNEDGEADIHSGNAYIEGKVFVNDSVMLYRPTSYDGTFVYGTGGNNLTTGAIYNTFLGCLSGYKLTSGNSNTLLGYKSGNNMTTGYKNTSNGVMSLGECTTGYANIALGYYAGAYYYISGTDTQGDNTNPIGCTYIGYSTRSDGNSNQYETVIGASAIGHGTNTVTLGHSSVTDIYMNDNGDADIHAGSINLDALNIAPSSSGGTGTLGEIRFTSTHIYVCVATDTWKRVAISTW